MMRELARFVFAVPNPEKNVHYPPTGEPSNAIKVERATLVDYLIIAEDQRLDLSLTLRLGALDVGTVGISGGRVVHATLPGATGEIALSLLAELVDARVVVGPQRTCMTNVARGWREIIDEGRWPGGQGRPQRLAQVQRELEQLGIPGQALSSGTSQPSVEGQAERSRDRVAARLIAELMDWETIAVYLGGDLEEARELLVCRDGLRPGDPICQANLERLRLRILDEQVQRSLSEADQ